MERRTNVRKGSSIRRELEIYVAAWNKYLVEAVKSMSIIILLRNAPPSYRADHARKLLLAGAITREQVKEFVKIL
jgi:hypothetical protein